MDVTADPPAPLPSRGTTALAVVGTVLVMAAVGSMVLRGRPLEVIYARWLLHNGPTAVVLLWLGHALRRRTPGHGLGHLFVGMGLVAALHVTTIGVLDARLAALGILDANPQVTPAALPLDASVPLWLSAWLWLPLPVLSATLLLLLFPTGRLPDRRWRAALPVLGAGLLALVAAFAISSWPTSSKPVDQSDVTLTSPLVVGLVVVGGVLVLLVTIASVASLAVRWRFADARQRQQLRTVGVAAAVMAVVLIGLWPWQAVWIPASLIVIVGFLIAYTTAVLRYRLHDLDVVINRTAVASILAAMATAVYLAVVVGIGSLVGRGSTHPLLPLLAVGVVAVLFDPARRRVRGLVDRLLYGRDADAYEVLSALSGQLRQAGSVDAVTTRVAALLVRGTGAAGALITMDATGSGADAFGGPQADADPDVEGGGRVLAAVGDQDHPVARAGIVHDGARLGEVVLFARSTSDLAPDAPVLLHDVAGTLGAVLRNAMLTTELEAQVEELRRSRQRLVTAQDQARRELERDIHDGAQARLVALRLQLGVAAAMADGPDAGSLSTQIHRLGEQADAAIRTLRDLSRGLSPPLLTAAGVPTALRADVRGLPVEARIEAEGFGRFEDAVETAVYFSCLEAVKNAATHAGATEVSIHLTHDAGMLRFTVEDDGTGFDPAVEHRGRGLINLDDRIAGLDGRLTVDAAPGRGTRIIGMLPAQPLVSER